MSKKTDPPWSDLPTEILQKIGESMGFSIYRSQFRAVCKSWRSSLPQNRGFHKNPKSLLSSILPLEIPYAPFMGALKYQSRFLVSTTTLVIQPTKGPFKNTPSLLTLEELNPGFLSPRYPLSKYSWHFRKESCRWLDLLQIQVKVVDQSSTFRILSVRRNAQLKWDFEIDSDWRDYSQKAVILSNPCCDDDLLAMVLFHNFRAMVLRVKSGELREVFNGTTSKCFDIVKYNDRIYGIDHQGKAFFLDYDYELGHVNFVTVAQKIESGEGRGKRLVVDSSSENLYMVVRMIRNNKEHFGFSVYRLNEDGKLWEKVKSLGNKMFFVGVDVSFCASVQDFPGLASSCMGLKPGNCIFFSKGSFPVRGYGYGEDGDRLLFGIGKEGTGMNIGHYRLRDQCATGLLEPAYDIMFSPPI